MLWQLLATPGKTLLFIRGREIQGIAHPWFGVYVIPLKEAPVDTALQLLVLGG